MQRMISSALVVFLITLSLISTNVVWNSAAKSVAVPQGQVTKQAADTGWPRGYALPSEAQIVMFQPQIASWDDQKHAVALAAVSYVAKGEQKSQLGTIKIEADTAVALEPRLVKFTSMKITESNFQTLS